VPSAKKRPVNQLPIIPHTLSPVTMMVSLSEPVRVLKCTVMHLSNVALPAIGRRNSFRKMVHCAAADVVPAGKTGRDYHGADAIIALFASCADPRAVSRNFT
jgi:hypothetical protein